MLSARSAVGRSTDALTDSSVSPSLQPPAVRTAIAVLMTRFPRIDETFILREV